MKNQNTHEVQIQHSGDSAFVVVESFLTRGKADELASQLRRETGRPVRINSPASP